MQTVLQDIRYGFRKYRRHYVLAVVVVATLALGLGVNTAIFSVVEAVLLRPLPFRDDHRLVRIYDAGLRQNAEPSLVGVSRRNFHAIREQSQLIESVAAQRYRDLTLFGEQGPERIVGIGVSENWLATLGVEPALGRDFLPEESRQGSDSTAVLISDGTWQRRFAGDPQILGRTLVLGAREYEVVGVLPPGFNYPYQSEVWTPMSFDRSDGSAHNLNVQARLRPGVSPSKFQAELEVVAERLVAEFPDSNTGYGLQAIPTRQVLLGDQHKVILPLFAAVGFLLLIVCVNIANLLLTSSITRQDEFAVRAALGSGRGRHVRQLMTEGILLSVVGGALGILLTFWWVKFLGTLIPPAMTYVLQEIPVDRTVLAYALGLSALTGIAFSLAPALKLSRANLAEILKSGIGPRGGMRSRRLLSGLVISEIALALVLLTGAAVMIENFRNLQRSDIGYSTENLLTMTVILPDADYSAQRRVQFAEQVVERIGALPGVRAAGITHCFPLPPENNFAVMIVEGRPTLPNEQLILNNRLVSPGFLRATGIPPRRGRSIESSDHATGPRVAVISEAAARRYWPGRDPLGEQVAWVRGGEPGPWMTIVGIVGDVQEPYEVEETWYLPYLQHAASPQAEQVIFTIRTEGDPLSLASSLRESVWQVDPTLPVFDVATVEQQYADTISEQRLGARALAIFSILGVVLAVVGIYGMMSYVIDQRTHELGIRIALGADARAVLGLVAKDSLILVLSGVALGVLGGVLLSRYLYSILPETTPLGPAAFAGVAILLALTALAACQIPARRATRVDPVTVLRTE